MPCKKNQQIFEMCCNIKCIIDKCFYLYILYNAEDFEGRIFHSLRVDNDVTYILFSTPPSLMVTPIVAISDEKQ